MTVRTASLWGTPPSRYYQLLRRVEADKRERLAVAIVGCSDGKFVLPAARRGHSVVAIDVDGTALFGGVKMGPEGETLMPGLVRRLEAEQLTGHVEVIHADFVEVNFQRQFDLILTSGALQYSRNMSHSMEIMVTKLQVLVGCEGYFYADYMLPLAAEHVGRDNYADRSRWSTFFLTNDWKVHYNRVLPPVFEKAHVDLPRDHYHHWGHILAQRVVSHER